jgi:hypothetical protein
MKCNTHCQEWRSCISALPNVVMAYCLTVYLMNYGDNFTFTIRRLQCYCPQVEQDCTFANSYLLTIHEHLQSQWKHNACSRNDVVESLNEFLVCMCSVCSRSLLSTLTHSIPGGTAPPSIGIFAEEFKKRDFAMTSSSMALYRVS